MPDLSPAQDEQAPRELLVTVPSAASPVVSDGLLFEPNPNRVPRRMSSNRPRKTAKKIAPVPIDNPAPSWVTAAQPLAACPDPAGGDPSPQPIQPLETRYAGCRFRSRLEARWAVWLDHLGIEWRYEPDTFLVGPEGRRRGYLPDFYLPQAHIWLEVKGDESALDYQKMLDAADPTGLPFHLGATETATWPAMQIRLVMLGEVPRQPGFHVGLAVLLGKLVVRQLVGPFCDMKVIGKPNLLAKQHGHSLAPTFYPIPLEADAEPGDVIDRPSGLLTSFGYGPPCPQVEGAYTAARSARFEHGESG